MRLTPLLLVVALFAAACAETDTTDETGPTTSGAPTTAAATTPSTAGAATAPSTTSTAPPPLTASFRGVTADTIRVGITAVDWDTLAAAGVRFGRTNSADLYEAALESINDRGGINGRMLEIYPEYFLPLGSTEFDAACSRLTDDNEVFVVIGQALDDQVLCFVELNDTAAIMVSGMVDSLAARADAPYATLWASLEQQAASLVDVVESAGVLDGATIGVIGSADVGVLEYRTIVDGFKNAGYEVVEGLIGDNETDLAETARDQAVIYERMRTAGVDFTVSTTGVPLEIANAADAGYQSDQWLLTVVMTSQGLADAGVDLDYLDGALAVVNTPIGTAAQPELADDPDVAACIDDLEARAGRELPFDLGLETSDLTTGLYACALAAILEAGLRGAGPELTNDTFLRGLESIGPIELPGYFEASLGPGDLGAAKGLRLVRFDASTGAWEAVE
jgi:ABC-type branched-subunit amino acid transport system substrate-binding protein